jgi:hypothetical protein
MRKGYLVLAAATLLLTGCHEYWGGSEPAGPVTTVSSYTVEPDPMLAEEKARSNVRAAVPAIEAWYADHGTYKGMTVAALARDYDRTIGDSVRLVGSLTKNRYCVESSVDSATWRKVGPSGLVEGGFCPDTAAPAPPSSYGEPQTNLLNAVPAIEAWNLDHGTYAGMTIAKLRAQYDSLVPSRQLRIVRAGKKSYCVESSVGGDTWSYWGPRQGFRHGGC